MCSGYPPQRRSVATSAWRRIEHRHNPRSQASPSTGFAQTAHEGQTQHRPPPPPPPPPSPASPSRQPPLQTLHDEASDVTVTVYPTTVALLAPAHGLDEPFHFDHVWLRDICQEEASVESATQQKLFHTSDIHVPRDRDEHGLLVSENAAALLPSTDSVLPVLQLSYNSRYPVVNAFSAAFSSAPAPSPAPHVSHIPLATLLDNAVPECFALSHGDIGSVAQPWVAADMSPFPHSAKPPATQDVVKGAVLHDDAAFSRPARVAWGALLKPASSAIGTLVEESMLPEEYARFALVDGLMRDGIAFVTDVPTDKTGNATSPDDPSSATLARLAEMLGEIRHTFYGSLWNVRSLGASSKNIAYTNLDLGLHMDLCYFQNPPRFQFLHMLRNRVLGGQSIFVDAFAVAEEMWVQHREAWTLLGQVPVCFQYRNDDRHYRYTHPTFEVAQGSSGHAGEPMPSSGMPRLTAVNYSPPFQGPLPLQHYATGGSASSTTVAASPQTRTQFYQALQTFADLTLQPQFRYERMLQEGECVVFDNRRVLHSRRGFEWNPAQEAAAPAGYTASEGGMGDDGVKRWLKGCYVDGDAIWSTYRTLLAKSRGGKLGLF